MPDVKLVKIYGNNEYIRLLYALDKKDYRWQSGQRAANPPFFFRKMTDSEGNDVSGIRRISVENKTIGYYPIEVLTDYEKQQILKTCLSVDDMISIIS